MGLSGVNRSVAPREVLASLPWRKEEMELFLIIQRHINKNWIKGVSLQFMKINQLSIRVSHPRIEPNLSPAARLTHTETWGLQEAGAVCSPPVNSLWSPPGCNISPTSLFFLFWNDHKDWAGRSFTDQKVWKGEQGRWGGREGGGWRWASVRS